jgi:hypothetical protein
VCSWNSREAARQRFLGIVVPPNKPAAAFRAWGFAANIMKLPVENRGAIRAGETAGHAFPNDIISQLEEIDNLQRQPALLETFIERGGLSQSPGKSIKDKPAVFVQPLPDNAQRQVVGKELALRRPAFRFDADFAPLGPLLAKHGSSGCSRNAEGRREQPGLGALPGSGRAEKDDAALHVTAWWRRKLSPRQ